MPQSRKRQHHHQDVPPPHRVAGKKNHAIIYVAIVFFGLLGTGIAYFAAGSDTLTLLSGFLIGGVAGYFFGYQIDKSITKK